MSDLSYEQKRALLMASLDPEYKYEIWIRDIYDDKVITEEGGKLFERGYSILDNAVTLGERKEVIISYEALSEIHDLEIFEAGTHRGKPYSEEDLDLMVQNFNDLKEKIKPTLVVGHSEEQELLKDSGIPSAGWAESLKRIGTKLVATFKDVPKVIADLINKGAYKRVSSEIYNNFEDKGYALRRVALLGGEIPEVKTLQDVVALYADTLETTWVVFDEGAQSKNGKEKEKVMPEPIIKLQEDITKLSEKVTALETENKALKGEKEQIVLKLSEKETAETKSKAREMVKPFREAGLAPAVAERLEAFAEGLDNSKVEKFGEESHTQLAEFNSILGSMLKRGKDGKLLVQFGEVAPGASRGEKSKDEERDEAVRKYREDNKADLRTAILAVSRQRPDLFKED